MSFYAYIESHRDQTFKWGLTDCIHFVGKGIRAQGVKTFDHEDNYFYRNEYWAKKSYSEFLHKHGVRSIEELFDKLYQRVNYIPEDGSIVMRKEPNGAVSKRALGFVSGVHAVFLGEQGLVFLPLKPETDKYWRIHV